jgi:hypothetical protein
MFAVPTGVIPKRISSSLLPEISTIFVGLAGTSTSPFSVLTTLDVGSWLLFDSFVAFPVHAVRDAAMDNDNAINANDFFIYNPPEILL